MNTYLIVAQIRRITKNNINRFEYSNEYFWNKYIEANTKKEALEQFNKFISEQNEINERYTINVDAVILNIIEL